MGNLAGTLETVVRGLLVGVDTPGPYALGVAYPLGSVMVGNHVDACNKIGKKILKKISVSNNKSRYENVKLQFLLKSAKICLMHKCRIKSEFQTSSNCAKRS